MDFGVLVRSGVDERITVVSGKEQDIKDSTKLRIRIFIELFTNLTFFSLKAMRSNFGG